MTRPVTTSKLLNQESVPCRMYSNSRSSHVPGWHGQIRRFAFERLHAGQFIQADRAFTLLGPHGGLRIHLTPLADLLVPLGIGNPG